MKSVYGIAGALLVLGAMSLTGIPGVSMKLVPEAQAFRGRGAAFVVGAAVGSGSSSSAAYEQQQATAAQQQAAAAQQQAATEKEKAAAAQRQAAAAQQQPSAPGAPLPLGTVVAALPAGCTATPMGGVNYYYCGGSFYQAVYEGSTLKYITTTPK